MPSNGRCKRPDPDSNRNGRSICTSLDRRIRKAARATFVASSVNLSMRTMVSIDSAFVNDNIFRLNSYAAQAVDLWHGATYVAHDKGALGGD